MVEVGSSRVRAWESKIDLDLEKIPRNRKMGTEWNVTVVVSLSL
ncbi:MAG: hypothetical protein ACI8RD_010164 [Bacillariaceae sp.]|jgi:hypothetical protein